MAPTKPGGRPKIAWTSSRKRKLVRLYLLSGLSIDEIQQALVATDFRPSTRNVQSQLGDLLPNLSTEWRQYRPTGKNQMEDRFIQIRRARANQVSKYTRRRARSALDAEAVDEGKTKATALSQTTPYYDPCRHYDENLPPGVPSHYFIPEYGAWCLTQSLPKQNQQTSSEAPDDCRFSDKEVVADLQEPILPDILDGSRFSALGAYPAIPFLAASGSNPRPAIACGTILTPDALREPQLPASGTGLASGSNTANTQIRGVKRNRSQLSSMSSIHTIRSIGAQSARSLNDSISSGISWSLSHIEAALSSRNSLRSSLVYAMSIASDNIPTSNDVPLSREEYLSWHELVDESMFPPTSTDHPQTSLQHRSCCDFFEKDTFKRSLCETCGFSEMHQLARCSLSDDGELIDSSMLDRFGNAPLHHAAAAGNTVRVLQLMSSASTVKARNTSGETCLHVLRLKGGDVIPDYLEILRKASSLGFQFSVRDYHGTTAADRLDELGKEFGIRSSRLREATEILFPSDVEGASSHTNFLHIPASWASTGRHIFTQKERKEQPFGLDRLKNKLGYSKQRQAKEVNPKYELDSKGDTKLIAILKSWSQKPQSRAQLEDLIPASDIHMRDRRGYTALAIAARYGLIEVTLLLLQQGSNPNTRSNQKTGVVAHVEVALSQAQKEGKDLLYARIFSCLGLLVDYGGKAVVDVFDEYSLPDRTSTKGKQILGTRASVRRPKTLRRITVDEFFRTSDKLQLQLHSDGTPPSTRSELCATEVHEMPAFEPAAPELEDHSHLKLYPLPLAPLPRLFALAEMRDEIHHRPKIPKLDSRPGFASMHNHPTFIPPAELEASRHIKFEDRKRRRIGVKIHINRTKILY